MPDLLALTYAAAAARFQARMQTFVGRVREEGSRAVQAQMQAVRQTIVATSPVDTGRLRASWSPVTQRGDPLIWGTGTTLDYAPTLEYGGYTRVGRRTVAIGGGDLGAGFVAGGGIYSRQAPLGFLRKALAEAAPQLRMRLTNMLQQTWGK
jgi:hypothetical protein